MLGILLCLGWPLALGLSSSSPLLGGHGRNVSATHGWHHLGSQVPLNDTELQQRCADEDGFDAVTLDEAGTMLFFKGDLVWKGFNSRAEPISASWPQIQGPVDAALRIHHPDHLEAHDAVYLFQGKRVWAYAKGKLRANYPRLIEEEFRGVPENLDAAVECHPHECSTGSVLFFKGSQVLSYDLKTGVLKQRVWPAVANCSSALRWLDRYYCFQGIRFLRFDPVTGSVPSLSPRDARDYFMRCPGRGHGHEVHRNATLRSLHDLCSGAPFQAFSSDDSGRIYAFREGKYFRVDSHRDGWHAWPLNHTWPDMQGQVDAAFSWEDKLYLIQGSQVSIYRSGQGFSRVEGYPRPLQEELGIASVDAAFTCPHRQDLYLIQGSHMRHVELRQLSRGTDLVLPHAHVDSAFCTATGVYLFDGPNFYHYANVSELQAAAATARPAAAPRNAAADFFRCPPAKHPAKPHQ